MTGTVADIVGGPIEGALVSVVRMDEGNILSFDRAPAGALTDEDGRFEFQVPSGQYTVSAHHAEYVGASETTEVADGPRRVALTLTPGATVSGIVRVHPSGEPLAGAIVVASRADANGGFTIAGFGEHRVVTDDAGRFTLQGLRSGVHGVSAVADRHATAEPVEVALGVAEQLEGVEVWVESAFKISGFVVQRGHEEGGLEGVLVGAFSMQPPAVYAAKAPSAEDGYFEVLGVHPGNYMVAAIGEETLPNFMGTGAQVDDADVEDVLVVMDPGVTLRGRVSPPRPASIAVTLDTEELGLSNMLTSIGNAFVRGRAEADGTFALAPVAAGKLKITATADDGSKGELSIEVADVDQDGLVIELAPRATLAGRVLDADGKPVAGATVKAQPETARERSGFTLNMNGTNPFGDDQATTTDDGTFVVRGLEGGAYLVSVSDRGPALAWAKPRDPAEPTAPLAVEVPADRGVADLQLVVEARNGRIRGVVVDADGGPVADAWVTAYREGSGKQGFAERTRGRDAKQRRAEPPKDEALAAIAEDESFFGEKHEPVLTDPDGQFAIDELRTGTYTLVAEADKGGAKARHKGVALGSRVRIEVAPLAAIHGVVQRAGRKVDDVTVTVSGPSDRTKRARAGEFRIDRLEPGKYEVSARGETGVAQTEVEVAEGATAEVKLELEGFGKLRGRLVDTTGEPIAGMNVVVEPERGAASMKDVLSMLTGGGPKTDDQGRFEVDEIPPGPGEISFVDGDSFAGGDVAEVKYTLEGDGEEDLGTITGMRAGKVAKGERGELGLSTHVASFAKRPRVGGDDEDRAAPDDRDRLWVIAVDVGGPADAAGVEPGDEITSIDGQDVASLGARTAAMLLAPHNVRAGADVSLALDRGGSVHTVSVQAKSQAEPDSKK